MYKYIIGIDPSGAYKEGMGTTGWCIWDTRYDKIIAIGSIHASEYNSPHQYWQAHIDMLRVLQEDFEDICVSIEDYVLYQTKATSQVNSTMETCQLLGIIKHWCYMNDMTYYIRTASQVKTRWSDSILLAKHYISQQGKHTYAACRPGKPLCDHERDAMRHAIHCAYFENK